MDIAVTPFSIQDIEKLADLGADAFILGQDEYANRLVKSFSFLEIIEANEIIKKLGKKIILNLNLVIHNQDLKAISSVLDEIQELNVDGIIFGDLALYNLAKEKQLEHLLIYNPETLNTNYFDSIFWYKKGIKGIVISKEITLEDIQIIAEKSPIETAIIGHGHLNMFHSRRPLISHFMEYNNQEDSAYLKNRNLRLIEELRHESYPVFQDDHGTHIFRDKKMQSYEEIIKLDQAINLFIIDGIFTNYEYIAETLTQYRHILKTKDIAYAKQLSEQKKESHDTGFLHKKTVYDKF